MAIFLRLHGHDVAVSRSAPDAIEFVRLNEPDIELLDLVYGIDGYDVAAKVAARRTGKSPVLIGMTPSQRESARQRSVEAGIDLHLVKPIAPFELAATLRNYAKEIYPTREH